MESSSKDILASVRPEFHPSFLPPDLHTTHFHTSIVSYLTYAIASLITKMNASELDRLDDTVTYLGFAFEDFKESMLYTSGCKRFQEQSQKLHIDHVNKELDKIQDCLTSLRSQLVHPVESIDAAVAAAKEMEKRAGSMAFENNELMKIFQEQNRAANERMENARKEDATARGLMKIAEKEDATARGLMVIAERQYADAYDLMKTAREQKAAAQELMNTAQKQNAAAHELMNTAQKQNAAAQNRINTAVLSKHQADVALAMLQQAVERWDETQHDPTKTLEPIRRVLAQKKLPNIKLDAEVPKQLETNRAQCNHLEGNHMTQLPTSTKEFEVAMTKRWDEVREKLGVGEEVMANELLVSLKLDSINDLKQARIEKAKLAYRPKSKQTDGPSQTSSDKGCFARVD